MPTSLAPIPCCASPRRRLLAVAPLLGGSAMQPGRRAGSQRRVPAGRRGRACPEGRAPAAPRTARAVWTTMCARPRRGPGWHVSAGCFPQLRSVPAEGLRGPGRMCAKHCVRICRVCGPLMIWQTTFPRDTPGPYGLSNTDQLETAGMRRGAPPGLPRRSRTVADPTARARLTLTRSVIASGRRYSTACGLTLSAWVEGLILTDDVDRFGRPRWAATPTGKLNYRSRTSDDPTQVLQLTLTHSTSATGRGRAIAAGLTFSGYIEALIRRELNRSTAQPTLALEKTA